MAEISEKHTVPPLLNRCTRMRFSGAGSESMAETMGFSGARRVASVAVLKYSGRERTEMIRVLG